MENITLTQIVGTIAIITAIWTFFKKINESIDTIFEKKLKPLKDEIKHLKDSVDMQSDITYQVLDHLATNNNTGGMKRALEEYNKFQRHNNE